MPREPTPARGKKKQARPAKAPLSQSGESKPDLTANPLLKAHAIHPDLAPLAEVLRAVVMASAFVAGDYTEMLKMKESHGLPKPHEWPGSGAIECDRANHAESVRQNEEGWNGDGDVTSCPFVEPLWTGLLRSWSANYLDWCKAVHIAEEFVKAPVVVALMDAGEPRAANRWTTQAAIELASLASSLHPIRTGGTDGLGYVRAGLPHFPTEFRSLVDAVSRRHAEVCAIPVTAVSIESDQVYRPASWFKKGVASRLRQAASPRRKSKRVSTQKRDGVVLYSVRDVERYWPEILPKQA